MGVIGQARAFAANAWAYVRDFKIDDILLPSIKDLLNWVFSLLPKAFGVRNTTPREQINANIVFIFFWATLSLVSLGTTLVLAAFHLFLLTIGVWRWLPAFDELWGRFRRRLPIKGNYNIPFWRSE
ncbi:MAG: hypothetical protein ABEJ68_08435 [Halobacteriaceae archaeon]